MESWGRRRAAVKAVESPEGGLVRVAGAHNDATHSHKVSTSSHLTGGCNRFFPSV